MNQTPTSEPAQHPGDKAVTSTTKFSNGEYGCHVFEGGLSSATLRQYAAIKLRVPDSGLPWLDAMIDKALRYQFAGQALVAFAQRSDSAHPADAISAFNSADAMLAASEPKGDQP